LEEGVELGVEEAEEAGDAAVLLGGVDEVGALGAGVVG